MGYIEVLSIDMTTPSAYHQIGKLIVSCQQLENAVNNLIVLMADADTETIQILINELEFSKRLKTTDVLFSHFVDLRTNTDKAQKQAFHALMTELGKLGERRNVIVHSNYYNWIDIDGKVGLLRTNSKLSSKIGTREEQEEELQPTDFDSDLDRLNKASIEIEKFRLKIIDWLHPV